MERIQVSRQISQLQEDIVVKDEETKELKIKLFDKLNDDRMLADQYQRVSHEL